MPETNYNVRKIVIVGIIILLLVALVAFLLVRHNQNASEQAQQKNLFPFGNGISTPSTGTGTASSQSASSPISSNPLSIASEDPLRVIAGYPVTNFYPFVSNTVGSEPSYNDKTGKTTFVSTSTPSDFVRFNAKQNGFLADAEVTPDTIVVTQKTNTQFPDAEEVWFANSGNTVAFRSWDAGTQAIDSFIGTLPAQPTLAYCTKPFTTLLTAKSKGPEVKEFQKYLNQKLALNLTVDGGFGKKIQAALMPLQKLLGIATTGTYDKATLDAVNADCVSVQASFQQQNSGAQKLVGTFLPSNISRGTVSPDGTQLFFLVPNDTGITGIRSSSDGTHQGSIFASPLTEWMPQWFNSSTIAMTTLASQQVDGFLYFLDPTTGSFKKILGPVQGLTTLVNPTGTTVLEGQSTAKSLQLSVYSTTTGQTSNAGVATLPAKCTWENATVAICAVPQAIPDGQYPDDWYQGNVTFNDAFWSIDTTTGATTNLFSPTQQFDAEDLQVSPDGNYLYFINKTDGSLWSYRLTAN